MIQEPKRYFKEQYDKYKKELSEEEAIESAFFDLKNKYKDMLELKLLLEIPELMNYLKKNPKGEKSFFHFGKPNSQLSQLNAALTQKEL